MCGIAGVTHGTAGQVALMLDAIAHRGPDARAITAAGTMIHGHVRLAMLDLSSASNQPFAYQGTLLSYNGELWNWRELRQDLELRGYQFHTSGDTEVLAACLVADGLEVLTRLDGMFAFAWTSRDGEQWLVRDAFGKVPLYVAKRRTGYAWASERKAFPRGERPMAVPQGHAFNLVTGAWRRWYHLPPPTALSPSQVIGHLREGVKQRLDADAPVCCLISGGLDSGIILALAQAAQPDVVAYTAVYDPNANDTRAARRLCAELGVPLVEVSVSLGADTVPEALQAIEIPSKAQTEIAVLCLPLARQIAADGFKACLSGESSDELFGGYGNFCIQASGNQAPTAVRKLRLQQLAKMSRGNFIRCNKVFMAHGVECRLPFMHQRLVESAVQLDLSQSPLQKKLLKDACRGLVPDWCINRPKDTFQGGSGISTALAKRIAAPVRFYNAEARRLFGYLPED